MLEPDGRTSAILVAELEEALADNGPHGRFPACRIPVITRTPETSESATNRFSPSVASPLGWAKQADTAVPSLIFSFLIRQRR